MNRLTTKKWQARFRADGKVINLGCFHGEEEAARAYDKAAREHGKAGSALNFPNETAGGGGGYDGSVSLPLQQERSGRSSNAGGGGGDIDHPSSNDHHVGDKPSRKRSWGGGSMSSGSGSGSVAGEDSKSRPVEPPPVAPSNGKASSSASVYRESSSVAGEGKYSDNTRDAWSNMFSTEPSRSARPPQDDHRSQPTAQPQEIDSGLKWQVIA